ncbi:MAG TPA: folylpolyglutamate synthase/dihydrofolate synthase family protein [Dinghuibacter sp.]|jgi:dihydrofolate synthase/folylpolyglutamate synthase|uniref:bifunctional folylpolyglutamate synthase/dihydrofolate synthase n=1 Tax=Dinghuibacter sp. TaxID=2024697 RepID=UPI002C8F7C98|nr:folylpolyglutamate synthase/dihydrofolate synthase family protein [Dinghuibacter sp.]HTJ11266.1 folylpolyglutamate synthase/dihydrofolate synthase family protein [Dinghuibacter sp.]
MNYLETVDYLFTRLPMFSRVGAAAYKADLSNTVALCEVLENPELRFKSIHIAGTNGKGSVSHMLAAILQSAGYHTGLYTSPHLHDFRERIKVDGKEIDEDFVVDFVSHIQPHIDKIDPSFFEITVAMAFDYFANQEVDIAVIETGLGGRLDSTNVITPELAIITNIGYDHMHLLGDTLEKIATEKAGIIKRDIPVVIGEFREATGPLFNRKAREKKAPISFADRERVATNWDFEGHDMKVEVTIRHTDIKDFYTLDLTGLYQTKNLVTVLQAVHQLRERGWKISDAALREGLAKTRTLTGLHGRWEHVHEHPSVILDVAHNEDGIRELVRQLEVTTFHQLHVIMGMVKDKDVRSVLEILPRDAHYYFTQAPIPRALAAEDLWAAAEEAGLSGQSYPDVNTALKEALGRAHKDDLVLVCGSVFVVGEVDKSKF